MNIVIFGATGGTGRCLVAQALALGHAVTAFVRQPAKLPIWHAALSVICGDVFDPAAVARAVAGQDAVLNAIGGKPALPSTLTGKVAANRVCSVGTQQIVAAMERHGVRRLVCETMHGIGDSLAQTTVWRRLVFDRGFVPLLLKDEVEDKARQEQIVRGSALDWIIVRPTQLTDGPPTTTYLTGLDLFCGIRGKISRADVASFMLSQLTDTTYLGQAPAISNYVRRASPSARSMPAIDEQRAIG